MFECNIGYGCVAAPTHIPMLLNWYACN